MFLNFAKIGQEVWKFSEPVVKTTAQIGLGVALFKGASFVGEQAARGVRYLRTGAADVPVKKTRKRRVKSTKATGQKRKTAAQKKK